MAEKTTMVRGVAAAVKRARARLNSEKKAPKAGTSAEAGATTEGPVPEKAQEHSAVPEVSPPKRKRTRKKPAAREAGNQEVSAVQQGSASETAEGVAPAGKVVKRGPEGLQEVERAQSAEGAQLATVAPKRKRGRPKGSKNKTPAQKAAEAREKEIARAARAGKAAAKRKKARSRRKGSSKFEPTAVREEVKKKAGPRKPPTTGQSAPPINLKLRHLNAKERDVLAQLNGTGTGARDIRTITELADLCFGQFPPKQANSWTRNSLRRLVQGQLVEKVERGKYRVSETGRRKLTKAA